MSIDTHFTAIPDYWMRRPDIKPPLKNMVGRVFTLSNIKGTQPEVSASGLAEQTGFGWDSADRVIKKLERAGVLKFKERRRIAGGYPFKVYSIHRPKLMDFMKSPASATGGWASASNGCHRPLPADVASARSGLKESGKECTKKNELKKGQPETSGPLLKNSGHDWPQLAAEEQNDAAFTGSPVDRFDKFILPEKSPTVSGTPPVPLEKVSLTLSGHSGFSVILPPENSASEAPPAVEVKKEADSIGQTTATKSAASTAPAPVKKYSPEYFRQMAVEQNRNMRLYGSPFGRR